MENKAIKKPKYLFGFEKVVDHECPVGSGLVEIYQSVKEPKTGVLLVKKSGTHDRQAEMDADAKSVNLKSLLEQANVGKIKKVPGVYGDMSKIPDNMFDARRNANAVASLWEKNPLIRSMYGTKDDYLLDITNGVDIEKKVNTFKDKLIENSAKQFAALKVKEPTKEESIKESTEKEVK